MAAFALFMWPLVTLAFFGSLGLARGLIWSTVVGYLFLPESYGFDLPALPPYDKYAAMAYSSLLAVLIFRNREPRDTTLVSVDLTFRNIQVMLFVTVILISPVMTWITNPETLVDAASVRPGLTMRDSIRLSVNMFIRFLPLFLAWRILTRPEHHRELLLAIVAFSVVYSFMVLFEWRMSPRFNLWVYGYFQSDWGQHNRGGGFRPLVFLQHGLVVGFLLMTAVLSAFALSRDEKMSRGLFFLIGMWLLLILFMSRNFGATFLALVFMPVVLLFNAKLQMRLIMGVAVLFILYPVLKQTGLSPERSLLTLFEGLSPERAASFEVRIRNEERLLDRAMEKPLFGWGGWARAHVFNEQGRDITLIDGIWIVILGQRGWVGFLAFFGFIVMPILFLARTARRKPLTPVMAGIATIMGANLIDMVPNSTLSPLAFLMVGAMAAYVQFDVRPQGDAAMEPDDKTAEARTTRYSRFSPGTAHSRRPARVTSYRRS